MVWPTDYCLAFEASLVLPTEYRLVYEVSMVWPTEYRLAAGLTPGFYGDGHTYEKNISLYFHIYSSAISLQITVLDWEPIYFIKAYRVQICLIVNSYIGKVANVSEKHFITVQKLFLYHLNILVCG
jgi:hypothetical protein